MHRLDADPANAAADPLRVMFIITTLEVGGAETLLVNLVRRFDRGRVTPEICCLKAPGQLGVVMAEEVPLFDHLLAGKYDLRVFGRLTSLLRRRRIDAIVTVGAGDKMFWGRLAARMAGVPVIACGAPFDRLARCRRPVEPLAHAADRRLHRLRRGAWPVSDRARKISGRAGSCDPQRHRRRSLSAAAAESGAAAAIGLARRRSGGRHSRGVAAGKEP